MVVGWEQLLFDSDGALVETVYRSKGLDIHKTASKDDIMAVLKDYMVHWMMGDDQESAEILLSRPSLLSEAIPQWNSVLEMAEGMIKALAFSRQHQPRQSQ